MVFRRRHIYLLLPAYFNTDCQPDIFAYKYTYVVTDSYIEPDSDYQSDSITHVVTDIESDLHADADPDIESDLHADADTDQFTDADTDLYSNSDQRPDPGNRCYRLLRRYG